ncbi:MAG: hypothetical protein ACYC56_08635 [Candidatus Aquicultor sp.]
MYKKDLEEYKGDTDHLIRCLQIASEFRELENNTQDKLTPELRRRLWQMWINDFFIFEGDERAAQFFSERSLLTIEFWYNAILLGEEANGNYDEGYNEKIECLCLQHHAGLIDLECSIFDVTLEHKANAIHRINPAENREAADHVVREAFKGLDTAPNLGKLVSLAKNIIEKKIPRHKRYLEKEKPYGEERPVDSQLMNELLQPRSQGNMISYEIEWSSIREEGKQELYSYYEKTFQGQKPENFKKITEFVIENLRRPSDSEAATMHVSPRTVDRWVQSHKQEPLKSLLQATFTPQ